MHKTYWRLWVEARPGAICCSGLSGGSWQGRGGAPELLADDGALVLQLLQRGKRLAGMPLEGFAAAGERREEVGLLEGAVSIAQVAQKQRGDDMVCPLVYVHLCTCTGRWEWVRVGSDGLPTCLCAPVYM